MTPVDVVGTLAIQVASPPEVGGPWLLSLLCIAGLGVSFSFHPPRSMASRAAWLMIAIGAAVAIGLQWADHRALLILGLPIVVAAAPGAVWRRTRGSQDDLPLLCAIRRLNWSMAGVLLFLFGVTQTAWRPEAQWPLWFTLAGTLILGGFCPVHRPATELIRHASPDLRPAITLLMGPLTWAVLAKWFSRDAAMRLGSQSSLLFAGPLISLWLGALLILARGDLGRLSAAAFLYAAGLAGTAMCFSTVVAIEVITALAAPLFLVVLLMARLERMTGSRETGELGGLLTRIPRFSIAFALSWMWFCGIAGLAPLRPLWTAWIVSEMPTDGRFRFTQLWPLLVPQIIVVWGTVRFLEDLLFGVPRIPTVPEPLRDLMPAAPINQNLVDLTLGECAAVAVLMMFGLAAAV